MKRQLATAGEQQMPVLLLANDIDNVCSRDGVRRVIIATLRELGLLPQPPGPKPPTRLRLVKEAE